MCPVGSSCVHTFSFVVVLKLHFSFLPLSGYCRIPDTFSDEALQLVEPNPSTLLFHDEVQFKCESKYYTLEGEEKYICDSDGIWRSVKGLEKWPKCIAVCGKTETDISSIGRILGGGLAKMGERPCQLLTKQPKRGGASLISDRWAITAARSGWLRRKHAYIFRGADRWDKRKIN